MFVYRVRVNYLFYMKGQYDIMEQEKFPEQEGNENGKLNKNYIWLLVIIAVSFVFCIRINELERELNRLKDQVEGHKLTLDGYEQGKIENSIAESPPVSSSNEETAENSAVTENNQSMDISELAQAKHKVYLTFDDGPSANTEAILDILDQYQVKATFFVLGKEDETSKERLRMIYERGHTIGMHSYSHVYSEIYGSLDGFKADFWKAKQYLLDTIGADCMFYRFPGGSSNTASFIDIRECITFLNEQGVEYYDWNIISGDGSSRKLPREEIVKNCTESIQNYGTSIILLHDASSKTETVEALPEIIETILAMEETAILPLSEDTKPVHHVVVEKDINVEESQNQEETDASAVNTTDISAELTIEETTGE